MMLREVLHRRAWQLSQTRSCRFTRHIQANAYADTVAQSEDEPAVAPRKPLHDGDGTTATVKGQHRAAETDHRNLLSKHMRSRQNSDKGARPVAASILNNRIVAVESELPYFSSGSDTSLTAISSVQRVKQERSDGLYILKELTPADLENAKQQLSTLMKRVEAKSAAVDGETEYQKMKRLQKAMTGHLDKLLRSLRQRHEYRQIEALAFVWNEALPQFANNMKHWGVISEYYAIALNHQQRFADVVEKFYTNQLVQRHNENGEDEVTPINPNMFIMTPMLAESVLLACGHLQDSKTALHLLKVLHASNIRVTKLAYFHLLNALLKDERFTDFDLVLELCEDLVNKAHGSITLSLLPTIIMIAAERGDLDRAMKLYNHSPDAPMDVFTEFRFDICLQKLWDLGLHAEMMKMYENVMGSKTATTGLKERVSRCLLLKSVKEYKPGRGEDVFQITMQLMEIMEAHRIPASRLFVYPFVRVLLSAGEDRIRSVKDLISYFESFPHVVRWNAFTLCEAVIACVRYKRVGLVDELMVHALDNNIPIKYAALEKVVAFYYKLGMMSDLEKVADIIRALRLNKHIPLGISVTEIGMSSNIRLGRYEEVIHLFEDFAAMDGERKRVLKRRIMLKSALTAYAAMDRHNEANAIRKLLGESYGNLLEHLDVEDDKIDTVNDESEVFTYRDDISEKNKQSDPIDR